MLQVQLNKFKHDSRASFLVLFIILLISVALATEETSGWAGLNLQQINIKRAGHIEDTQTFTLDTAKHGKRLISARLCAIGKHTFIWVDSKQPIPNKTLSLILARFDNQIYSRNIEYFANSHVRKQVTRVDILITNLGISDGYFDSGVLSGPSKLNLIYLDSDTVREELTEAYNTLAHEFAHLIYYKSGGANIEWLDEGLAVYAEYINGGNPSYYISSFRKNPNIELTGRFINNDGSYGAAFLFITSAVEQVKQSHNSVPQFIQELITNSNHGKQGIDATMHKFISNPQLDSINEISFFISSSYSSAAD